MNNYLLKNVKEKGIVNIINNYMEQIEISRKYDKVIQEINEYKEWRTKSIKRKIELLYVKVLFLKD
jgi:superfamily I DNA and/or RNA helicase